MPRKSSNKSTKLNQDLRQVAIIEALLDGPKTIIELEQFIVRKLDLKDVIPEATRNRDLRDLRAQGFQIDLDYQNGVEPSYVLRRTKLELNCEAENLATILHLLRLGSNIGILVDENLDESVDKLSELLKLKAEPLRIDGLRKLLNLNKQDLKQIHKAIEKNCSINFKIKQASDSKIKSITAFPKEIFLQDKFLYLAVKQKLSTSSSYDWREYRLDCFMPIEKNNCITINNKDLDPSPQAKCEPIYCKVAIYSPLKNFFHPSIHNLKKIESKTEFDIYEGYVYKQPFRILKDYLALLPHVQILGNKELASQFRNILSEGLKNQKHSL